MDRRHFLANAAWLLAATPRSSLAGVRLCAPEIPVHLDLERTVANVPPDFIGLGYETSAVARRGLLSAQNSIYIQLVRTLGHGVVRVGGNTSDYASYSPEAAPLSSPEGKAGSMINDAVLADLGSFLDATGWQLIWGLNLGNGTVENAIAEAQAVTRAIKGRLLAFEIGNEPDLFPRVHRQTSYQYDDYLREFRRYRDALQKAIPGIAFAGPDVAGDTAWVRKISIDEGRNIKLLTHHYYRGSARNRSSTIDELLRPDPKLGPMLAQLAAMSHSCGVPYRICETNSFSSGGKPGVSDTLAAALWGLDFMFTLASAGCAGVNMETGVNQLGFISSYSPIEDDGHAHYWAAAAYYGMLAFAQAAAARIVGCTIEPMGKNVTAYAAQTDPHHVVLTFINKERSCDSILVLDSGLSAAFQARSVIRLEGPSLESKSGITLAGASVADDGTWKPTRIEEIAVTGTQARVSLPRASAAIVHLWR